MNVEAEIKTLLGGLVAGRVYPDVAPAKASLPRIVYQQVGGRSLNYVDQQIPDVKNGRFQLACWAATREAATALALQVEAIMILAEKIQAQPLGAHASTRESDTGLYGARQDFDVWSAR